MVLERAQLLGGPLDGRDMDVPAKLIELVCTDHHGQLQRYRRRGKRRGRWVYRYVSSESSRRA